MPKIITECDWKSSTANFLVPGTAPPSKISFVGSPELPHPFLRGAFVSACTPPKR